MQPPTLNGSASALRFFFGTALDRAELARHLARVHFPRKLPRVLSPEEVGRLLEAAPVLRRGMIIVETFDGLPTAASADDRHGRHRDR